MKDIHVSFGPVDTLNPGFGYSLLIERARTGEVLLRTSNAPDTGAELRSAEDCLRVV